MRIPRSNRTTAVLATFAGVATLAALAACVSFGRRPATAAAQAALVADSLAPPIVQLRAFRGAARTAVVAWTPWDNQFGLRTDVNEDGSLVGALRSGEHRLFVSAQLVQNNGDSREAMLGPQKRTLAFLGFKGDDQACRFGDACSPLWLAEFNVPDQILRAQRDSFVVTFRSTVTHDWSITLRPELIDRYLATVDSVAAARRTKQVSARR